MAVNRRDELLETLVDHVAIHGLESASFRTLAEAAGVAHNTLTYHFGSRAKLIAAIFQRLAHRVPVGTSISFEHDGSQRDRLHDIWSTVSGTGHQTLWANFYEMLGIALRDPEQHRGFLTHVTDDWTTPLTDELTAAGHPAAAAAASATFVVAAIRGLALDAMAGGDSDRINGAFTMLADFVTTVTDGASAHEGGSAVPR